MLEGFYFLAVVCICSINETGVFWPWELELNINKTRWMITSLNVSQTKVLKPVVWEQESDTFQKISDLVTELRRPNEELKRHFIFLNSELFSRGLQKLTK